MKYYEDLLAMGCFSRADLIRLTGSDAAARSLIYDYQHRGYIERVKRDLYVVISLETKQPLLTRYQIGSNLFPDACISHHSAFEVYGYVNQVFYECYVATESRFKDIEYDGVIYHRIEKKPFIRTAEAGGVRVTSPEQTAVDSIRDFEKIAGFEEVIRCLMLIPDLREKDVLSCLKCYDNGFLYQKCGYIFGEMRHAFRFSKYFFDECKKHRSDARRYLIKESRDSVWNAEWGLYTPPSLENITDKGVGDNYAL